MRFDTIVSAILGGTVGYGIANYLGLDSDRDGSLFSDMDICVIWGAFIGIVYLPD